MSEIKRHDLECGLTLLVERNANVQSVGLTWLLPIGSATDPTGTEGASTILAEWIWRGAGDLNARAHSAALDRLGVQRSSQVETYHLRIGATMIADRLSEALALLTPLFRRPMLADETFEPVRDLTVQAIEGLADDPQQRAMLALRGIHFPEPFNRSGMGELDDVRNLSPEVVRNLLTERAVPHGSILAICGNVDDQIIAAQLEDLLADWRGTVAEPVQASPARSGHHYASDDSAQVHIGIAFDAPPEPDDRSMLQRVATAVLSGGMSGRLFTEIRERRGLCYSVHCTYLAGRDRGALVSYAGTTPERAQQTFDVLLGELRRLGEGIEEDEFSRALIGLKSRLVMHGESTSARADAIAHDQFIIGRTRTLEELGQLVQAVTLEAVNDFVKQQSPGAMSVSTLGPTQLTTGL